MIGGVNMNSNNVKGSCSNGGKAWKSFDYTRLDGGKVSGVHHSISWEVLKFPCLCVKWVYNNYIDQEINAPNKFLGTSLFQMVEFARTPSIES
jgi:hypothetical protein